MKRILTAVCCIALAAVPVLGQTKHAMGHHEKAGMPEKGAMTDQQFVDFVGQVDMLEANLGQLAQDVAARQDVKDYGQMLVTDHTANYEQLKTLAQQQNLTVPTAINDENIKKYVAPMHELKGAAFDRKFIPAMISGHEGAIAAFKKEAADAQNPAIKSFAEDTIPVLEKHLDHAQALAKAKPAAK